MRMISYLLVILLLVPSQVLAQEESSLGEVAPVESTETLNLNSCGSQAMRTIVNKQFEYTKDNPYSVKGFVVVLSILVIPVGAMLLLIDDQQYKFGVALEYFLQSAHAVVEREYDADHAHEIYAGSYYVQIQILERLLRYLNVNMIVDNQDILLRDVYRTAYKLDRSGRLCPDSNGFVGRREFHKRVLVTLVENGYEYKSRRKNYVQKIMKKTQEKYDMEDAARANISQP